MASKKAKAKYSSYPPWFSYAPGQIDTSRPLPSNKQNPLDVFSEPTHEADFTEAENAQIFIPYLSSVDLARRANLYPYDAAIDAPSSNPSDVERWISRFGKGQWKRLSQEVAEEHLPHNPPVQLSSGSSHGLSDFAFGRFEGTTLEATSKSPGCLFNAGGSVIALDWQRQPRNAPPLTPSLIAVSVLNNNGTAHAIGAQDLKAYKSSIQLWSHTPRYRKDASKEEDITPAQAKLVAVLCNTNGLAVDLKFSPTDAAYMEYGDETRVAGGAIAATFNNGHVDVALLPDITLLRQYYGMADDEVLYLDYVPTLSLNKPLTKGLVLEWASSNRLAVGFSNGSMAVYDVRQAIRERKESVRPRVYFDVHMGGINGLQWVMIPPHNSKSLQSGAGEFTQILSSGYDGSFFVSDIRIAGSGNNGAPTMFEHVRGITYAVGYSIHANAMLATNAENTLIAQGLLATDYKRGSQLTDFGCPILDICTSTCHPFVAIAGSNGHVEVINPLAIVEARTRRQQVYYWQDVYGIEYSRNDDKYQMIDHLDPPNNRQGQDTASKQGKGAKLKVVSREELARFAAPFPAESGVNVVRWNPDANRSAVLASGMFCGMVRLDELWDM